MRISGRAQGERQRRGAVIVDDPAPSAGAWSGAPAHPLPWVLLWALVATLLLPGLARAEEGWVVWSGAATQDRWQRLLERSGQPERPGAEARTLDARDPAFMDAYRHALALTAARPALAAAQACETETMNAFDRILGAREALDAAEWDRAIEELEHAKARWHCATTPAPLAELSEVYFLSGVALYSAGRVFAANAPFALAFATGVEPPGVGAFPPDVREAYYTPAIDPTKVPRVPLSVDARPLDGLKLWIDGKEAGDAYDVGAGEHVLQLTNAAGRLLASQLITVDASQGGGLNLPGTFFPLQPRLDTVKALDKALLEDAVSFAQADALERLRASEQLPFLVVATVDPAAGDVRSYTVAAGGQGRFNRAHLLGAGLGEAARVVYPSLTGAFVVGATGAGLGYALSFRHLSEDLFPSEDAVDAAQRRGYTALTLSATCAAGAAVTGTLWAVHARRERRDLIYGQAPRLQVTVLPTGASLTMRF